MSEWATAFLGIGANLGDRADTLTQALVQLNALPDVCVVAASSVYETAPVGVLDQPDFLNAVVQVNTLLSPRALLEVLLATELQFGRKRLKKWGPRLLDLDILLYEDRVIDETGLAVPHPYLQERAFVLCPLCDLCAEAVHPVLKRSFADLLKDVDTQSVVRVEGLSLWK